MHEQTGHDAMIAQRGYVKPWPKPARVVVRAVMVAGIFAALVLAALGVIWMGQHYPTTSFTVGGALILLLIGWAWDET